VPLPQVYGTAIPVSATVDHLMGLHNAEQPPLQPVEEGRKAGCTTTQNGNCIASTGDLQMTRLKIATYNLEKGFLHPKITPLQHKTSKRLCHAVTAATRLQDQDTHLSTDCVALYLRYAQSRHLLVPMPWRVKEGEGKPLTCHTSSSFIHFILV